MKIEIKIPAAFHGLHSPHRYKVYYGGRGAAKSWSVATVLVVASLQKKLLILCTRELQKSISESVHRLLSDMIKRYDLQSYFTITKTSIKAISGSEFIFAGLRSNITEIKSTEGIDICWVEEAQRVSDESWRNLIPTVRKENSEIWVTFNPDEETDPTYARFVLNPPDNAIVTKVNYDQNPDFPDTLRAEMEYMKRVDYEQYLHVWEGECKKYSEAVIFSKKFKISFFEAPENAEFLYGADWGFSQDPTTLIRCFILDECLYVDYIAYEIGCDIDKTGELFAQVPGAQRGLIRADRSRPETISYLNRQGFNIIPAKQLAGSVEDGILFLRSFEWIIVHERCKELIFELRNYSYKLHSLTGLPTTQIEDKNNHCIDALRYAVEPLMKGKNIFIGRV